MNKQKRNRARVLRAKRHGRRERALAFWRANVPPIVPYTGSTPPQWVMPRKGDVPVGFVTFSPSRTP